MVVIPDAVTLWSCFDRSSVVVIPDAVSAYVPRPAEAIVIVEIPPDA